MRHADSKSGHETSGTYQLGSAAQLSQAARQWRDFAHASRQGPGGIEVPAFMLQTAMSDFGARHNSQNEIVEVAGRTLLAMPSDQLRAASAPALDALNPSNPRLAI